MIQRIQTLFLLAAAVCLGLTFAFPFASIGSEVVYDINGLSGNSAIEPFLPIPLTYIVIALIAFILIVIASFNNRRRQLLLGKFNYIAILGVVALILFGGTDYSEKLGLDNSSVTYGIGTYLPLFALLFIFLANRAIKKDDELVRSSTDRIR